MKKFSVLLVGALALLVASCGYKSEEKPLTGTLVTYTAEGTQKGEILLGVKDKSGKKDKTIVPAAAYASITADENYITCTRNDAAYDVYTLSGTPLTPQTYTTFGKQTIDNNTFYVGTAAETIYYLFPDKPVISSNLSYLTTKNLFIQTAATWDVYTFDGKLIWNFPINTAIIKSTSKENYVVVVPVVNKKVTTYKFYTPSGKELKQLNAAKWKKFQKQLKNPQKLGETELYELETIKIEKLTI